MRTVRDPWLARANLGLPLAFGTKITTSGVALLVQLPAFSGKRLIKDEGGRCQFYIHIYSLCLTLQYDAHRKV